MTISRVEQAARNNAIWCDTLCRAHGAFGEFHESVWLNRNHVPRFYPNLVTLTHRRDAAAQMATIQDLIASGLSGRWSVKDSFYELRLDPLDFQILFEAAWLWREPSVPLTTVQDHGIDWLRLQDRLSLAQWEIAWDGHPPGDTPTQRARLFLPSLLNDPNIAFFAGYKNGEIVAGAIANRTDHVVGLSNVFTPAEDKVSFWAGCVAAVQNSFLGLPLTGYENGLELSLAEAVGFEKLQKLRVWVYSLKTG